MYDDGTHGDKVAGDGIYTAIVTFTPPPPSPLRYHQYTVDWIRADVFAYDSGGNQLVSVNSMATNVNIGLVDPAQSTPNAPIAENLYSSPHAVNVVVPSLGDGTDYERAIAQQLYGIYPDVFDGLVLIYVGNTRAFNGFIGNWPHSDIVKVTESGIGTSHYDLSAYYGSAGKLQTILSLDDDIAGSAFLHEFSHRWGFYLNDTRLKLTDGSKVHIASPSTLIGQLGSGNFLSEQANGRFLVDYRPDGGLPLGNKYADWELYLMGYLSPTSVAAERFVLDTTVNTTLGSIVPRASTNLIPISGAPGSASVVGIYGDRIPDAASSQHNFKVLFVAVSDRPLTLAESSMIERDAAYFSSQIEGQNLIVSTDPRFHTMPTFWSATKYLGLLDTTFPAPK
jgi:hypothetical protein